jgi:hypothetical protein
MQARGGLLRNLLSQFRLSKCSSSFRLAKLRETMLQSPDKTAQTPSTPIARASQPQLPNLKLAAGRSSEQARLRERPSWPCPQTQNQSHGQKRTLVDEDPREQ